MTYFKNIKTGMNHKAHASALKSFNLNHASYDQFRPNFSPRIVDKFLKDLNLFDTAPKTDKVIVELAAGTGKFTRNLTDHGWKDNLIVVEPSEGMLESFQKNFPDIQTYNNSSYSIPLSDGIVDAVVIAQGFHWFSDRESLKEIKRVLKPTGKFGCIWNFDGPSVAQKTLSPEPAISYLFDEFLQDKFDIDKIGDSSDFSSSVLKLTAWNAFVTEFLYSFDAKVPQYRKAEWKTLLMKNEYFKPIQSENYLFYNAPIARDLVYDYWLTRSYITNLPEDEKVQVKETINKILDKHVTKEDEQVIDGVMYLQRIMGTHTVVTEPK